MITAHLPHPLTRAVRLATLTILLVSAVVLAGCSTAPSPGTAGTPSGKEGEEPQAVQEPAVTSEPGSATAVINGRTFTFTLSSCGVYQDSEVELSGPGAENSSDVPSHLDGGLLDLDTQAHGEFRINVGTSQKFDSSDEFLTLGSPTGENLTVAKEGDTFRVTADAWDDQGADLGQGTLSFTCQ